MGTGNSFSASRRELIPSSIRSGLPCSPLVHYTHNNYTERKFSVNRPSIQPLVARRGLVSPTVPCCDSTIGTKGATGLASRMSGAPEERKQAIARATCRAILEQGLHRVNLRDIARALGTTTGPLQHYFRSKEELLLY